MDEGIHKMIVWSLHFKFLVSLSSDDFIHRSALPEPPSLTFNELEDEKSEKLTILFELLGQAMPATITIPGLASFMN